MSKPMKEHWAIIKSVFMYLCGTKSYTIYYQRRPIPNKVLDVHGFVDVDWVGDLDHKIYTSGYVFSLFGGKISGMSERQAIVALSTTEIDYMAVTHASKEAIWLQRLCLGIRFLQKIVRLHCDSQNAIFMVKSLAYHSKM